MKRKISKEEYEKLSEEKKVEYGEKNGSYFLKLDDDDEAIEALKTAKENERREHNTTKKQLRELQELLDEKSNNDSRKKGDVEALEKSWSEKLTKRENDLNTEISKLKGIVVNSTRESVITALASKIVKPESIGLFKKSISDRFNVELDGEKPVVRILGLDGKPSAMAIEDLEKEILADKQYAPIIIASRANGGSGKPDKSFGGRLENTGDKPLNLAGMSPRDLAQHISQTHSKE